MSTIGLVFVSYAGLTKVASVAEEVDNPDVNIPLGMTLSLATATVIYTLGTIILINVLDQDRDSGLAKSIRAIRHSLQYSIGAAAIDLGRSASPDHPRAVGDNCTLSI